MLIYLALLVSPVASEAEERLARMTLLYQDICLKTFPDDKSVEALMTAQGARELTQAEVKVTMRDDPARGWELKDKVATVWIEFPPFHACSVRWNASEIGDLALYKTIAAKYEIAAGGFQPMSPYNDDQDDIHIHAVGEQKILPDKSTESLFIFDQHISNAKRREAGETGVSLRFVHQFTNPTPPTLK